MVLIMFAGNYKCIVIVYGNFQLSWYWTKNELNDVKVPW